MIGGYRPAEYPQKRHAEVRPWSSDLELNDNHGLNGSPIASEEPTFSVAGLPERGPIR
jgi:hypothetical protein